MAPFSFLDGSFRSFPQYLIYILALVIIPLAAATRADWLIGLLLLIFAIYDFSFLSIEDRFIGRDVEKIVADLRSACGYMAYFLPLAAFILAFSDLDNIKKVLSADAVIVIYLFVGIVTASVATLFIPVQYSVETESESLPSSALRLCFVIVLLLQKIAVTTFACAIIRAGAVVYQLSQQSGSGG